ncbi:MAG TPA: sugar-binding protein, partial [bacterium]|nr:sugar-binding protein [bacterium]
YAAAWACYRKASADDNVVGDVRMAFMTHNGFGVPKDDPLALKLYTDAANRDHRGWSSWVLGDNYYWGICRRDPSLARMWLERAVFQGYRPAGLDLARLAENGDGQPEDPMLALAYYRCAAYSNDPETEREYGRVLYEGRLGPPDYAQAARHLSAAAQAGDATAAGILGAMMDQGLGLPKDPDGARRLWTQGMGGPGSWTWKGRPAVIARARRTPNMDGGLAAFQGVPKLRFDAAKAGPRLVRDQPGPGEAFRATAQLMRDDHNLYLGLDVTQREPPTNGGSVDRDLWDGDSAELFVCAKTELTGLTRGAKSYFDDQYIVAPTSKDGAPRILAVDHPRGGARVAVRRTRRGYTLCAAVPLADLAGLDWTPGSLIRFELSLAKAGKDGHRWARVFFNATGRASGSPDDWGEARVE